MKNQIKLCEKRRKNKKRQKIQQRRFYIYKNFADNREIVHLRPEKGMI